MQCFQQVQQRFHYCWVCNFHYRLKLNEKRIIVYKTFFALREMILKMCTFYVIIMVLFVKIIKHQYRVYNVHACSKTKLSIHKCERSLTIIVLLYIIRTK